MNNRKPKYMKGDITFTPKFNIGDKVTNTEVSGYTGKIIRIFPTTEFDGMPLSFRTENELTVSVGRHGNFGYQVEWMTGVSNPWREDELGSI